MKFLTQKIILFAAVTVLFGCNDKSSLLVPASEPTGETFTQKPTGLVNFNPKVDILFVIDNSASMSATQANLSRNVQAFSKEITASTILDFHIGVVSTDMSNCYYSAGRCGDLLGRPKFIDKNTPNAGTTLEKNLLIGINGSGLEEMFTPAVKALNHPSNVGFYRQDAYLAIIFITDAKDQSSLTPDEFLKILVATKGDASKVLAYGVIRKLVERDICRTMYTSDEEELDSKLETFLASVVNADKKQNNVLSLCATDYGIRLSQFANDIIKRSAGTIRLQRMPDTKTIKVTYGTQVIANNPIDGWTYENSTNSVILAPGIKFIEQGPGVSLSVDFESITTVIK